MLLAHPQATPNVSTMCCAVCAPDCARKYRRPRRGLALILYRNGRRHGRDTALCAWTAAFSCATSVSAARGGIESRKSSFPVNGHERGAIFWVKAAIPGWRKFCVRRRRMRACSSPACREARGFAGDEFAQLAGHAVKLFQSSSCFSLCVCAFCAGRRPCAWQLLRDERGDMRE